MEAKQTSKKIVSKGVYAALVSKKASLWSMGAVFNLIAVIMTGVFASIIFVRHTDLALSSKWAFFLIAVSLSFVIREIGRKITTAAKAIQTGVPLTRANTGDIPTCDSLVRASHEPIQEQQAVLLRGAEAEQEKHEEQLLRAVGGNDD